MASADYGAELEKMPRDEATASTVIGKILKILCRPMSTIGRFEERPVGASGEGEDQTSALEAISVHEEGSDGSESSSETCSSSTSEAVARSDEDVNTRIAVKLLRTVFPTSTKGIRYIKKMEMCVVSCCKYVQ